MRSPVTPARLVRSEWRKLWSLRSTRWICAGIVLGQSVLTALLAAITDLSELGYAADRVGPELLNAMYPAAQLAIAVLAVLAITGEYSTGTIRSTFAAAPRRTGTVVAKGLVLAVTALLTGAAASLLTWALLVPRLGTAYAIRPGDPVHLRLLLAMPLYLAGIALFGYGIGLMVRRTAPALGIVLATFLVVDTLAMMLQRIRLVEVLTPFLPAAAGTRLLTSDSGPAIMSAQDVVMLGPWQGWGVLLAWAAVVLLAGLVLVRRRDA